MSCSTSLTLESGLEPKKLAIVAGNSSRLEAKIGGITPDMLSLDGRGVVCTGYIFPADLTLGVVDRDAALGALDEHAERRHADDDADQQDREQRVHLAGADRLESAADGAGHAGDDAGQDDHRDTITDAAFGD